MFSEKLHFLQCSGDWRATTNFISFPLATPALRHLKRHFKAQQFDQSTHSNYVFGMRVCHKNTANPFLTHRRRRHRHRWFTRFSRLSSSLIFHLWKRFKTKDNEIVVLLLVFGRARSPRSAPTHKIQSTVVRGICRSHNNTYATHHRAATADTFQPRPMCNYYY